MILIDVRSIFEWLDPGGPGRGGPVRLLNQGTPLRTLAHVRAQALFDRVFYPPPITATTTTTKYNKVQSNDTNRRAQYN